MLFLCFSYGFPMVFLGFSYGFPMVFLGFPMVFLWFSCGFPGFSYGFPMVCEQKGAPPRLLESGHAEAFAAIAACERHGRGTFGHVGSKKGNDTIWFYSKPHTPLVHLGIP